MITYNGKESEKEQVHVYMYKLNHFAVLLKVIQHCKSKIYIKKEEEE